MTNLVQKQSMFHVIHMAIMSTTTHEALKVMYLIILIMIHVMNLYVSTGSQTHCSLNDFRTSFFRFIALLCVRRASLASISQN